jgi:hypothetical protein
MAVEGKERGLEKNLQRFEHIPALIQKDRSTGKDPEAGLGFAT